MSHFTVLVIGNDVEAALAPFQENNMGSCPQEYLEFNEVETEYRQQYETDTIERVVMPDGSFKSPYDESFKVGWEYTVPDYLERKQVPLKEVYKTFNEYIEDYCGYNFDEEMQKYGYWENPNAKWDWYQIGGRWTGFFKIKSGGRGEIGTPGVFGNQPKEGYADQALKGDIDFVQMLTDAEEEANETFDKVEELLKGVDLTGVKTWPAIYDECSKLGITRDEMRDIYRSHPAVDILENDKDLGHYFGCNIQRYCLTSPDPRKAYVADRRCASLSTFAVVYKGEWYEKGEMGWFGCVSDEKSKYDWSAQFMDILESLPDDTLLTVVDCHI